MRRVPPAFCGVPDLLCVGHLVPDKRFDLAIRSLRRLHDSGMRLTLMVLGAGPQRAELERLTGALLLSDVVTFQEPWPEKQRMVALLKAAKCSWRPPVGRASASRS